MRCLAPCGSWTVSKWVNKCLLSKLTNLWSAKAIIGSLHFHAGCCRRQLNLALVFCLFCIVVHFFWLVNVWFCCVRLFFHTKPRNLLWERLRNDLPPLLYMSVGYSKFRWIAWNMGRASHWYCNSWLDFRMVTAKLWFPFLFLLPQAHPKLLKVSQHYW